MAAQGSSSNDRNEDLPAGYVFTITDESLLKSLIKLHEHERFSTDGRLARIDLFAKHPALVINENKIDPGMRDNCNYYYFYCEVPDGTPYDLKGYQQINNREEMGLWQENIDSSILPTLKIDIGDDVVQSNMVICEVFERAESETAEAVRSAAEAKRNFDEILTLKVSQAAKVEQMKAALQVEQAKYEKYLATTDARRGVCDERLTDRANAERKEANDIIARR